MNESQVESSLKIDIHQYGDQYPIIWCAPEIDSASKKSLKNLIQANKLIHTFQSYSEAREFAQSLGISFVIIIPYDASEEKLYEEFSSLKLTYGRRMGKDDDEEREAFRDLIKGASEGILKSIKAYVFFTQKDYFDEAPVNHEEEEVTVMKDVNQIANEFRQEFTIILYDPKMNSATKAQLVQDLGIEIEAKNLYTKLKDLLQRIKKENDVPYHLIMAGKDLDEKAVNEVTCLKDLLGLYLYRDDDGLDKIKHEKLDKTQTLEELIPKIKEGIRTRSKLRHNFPAFAPNFGSWDRSLINSTHHYLNGFINFRNRKQAKDDFVKLALKIYQDQKKMLFDFQREYDQYDKEKILHWYTKESPIYRLINNCLRIASSDSVLYCRFGLKEMERAIRDQYQEKDKDLNGVVYRGAYISQEEWESLLRNIGQEIEMYGFLSTTLNQRTALNFMKDDEKNKIFIMILVPPLPEPDDQGFTRLSCFSEYPAEKEILFNVRSKFQILQAFKNKNGPRFLILLYGAQTLRKYMTKNKPSINIELELPLKETIKCNMCENGEKLFGFQGDTTQIRCFECLVKHPIPKDTPLVSLNEGDMKSELKIAKSFPGKFLQFTEKGITFAQSDYKCCDCQGIEKKSYYRWITQDGKDIKQCSDCFEKKREIKAEILVSETYPYTLWLEHQMGWEKIDTEYKARLSKSSQDVNESDVYDEVRDFSRCVEYCKKVLKKLRFTRYHERKKLMTYNMLGTAYESLMKHQEAASCFKMTLCIRKLLFDPSAISSEKLLSDSMVNGVEKLPYDLTAIKSGKFPCDPMMMTYYNKLADVYLSFGKHEFALKYYGEALAIAKSVYGERHFAVATSYNGLAALCNTLGEPKKALEYFENALQITKSILGENHPETATSYNNIACVYHNLSMFEEAKENFEKAFTIKDAIFGENHPEAAVSYLNHAEILKDFGEYEKAIEYFKKVIKILEPFFGEKHSHIANAYNGLGTVSELQGKYQDAIKYFSKAMEITEYIKGKDHTDTATIQNNMALVCKSVESVDESLAYLIDTLAIQKNLYGEVHPSIATTYTNLALLYLEMGFRDKALSCAKKSLDMTRSIFGEMHRDTANSYNNLGIVYEAFRDFPNIIQNFTQALKIYEYVFKNRDHPETASVCFNLGCNLMMMENYQQAKDYLQKSYNMRTKFFPPESSEMAESKMLVEEVENRITGNRGKVPGSKSKNKKRNK